MKLKTLLETHRKYSKTKDCLRKNFGDGYLLAHNPIYRSIRRQAIEYGFKFTSKRFGDYDVLALTQLPKILSQKMIPYSDNLRPLLEIEKQDPGTFAFSDIPAIRPNQVFHESAHGVGYSLVQKHLKPSRSIPARDRLLQLLLQEAFSNACESFSNVYSTNSLHDEFLYKNSYIMEESHERAILKAAIRKIGADRCFELLLLSFLYANFIAMSSGLKNIRRILRFVFRAHATQLARLKKSEIALLKDLFKIGFGLDQDFTIFTNGFIFKQLGFKEPLAKLLAFDFLSHLEEDERYQACLSAMVLGIFSKRPPEL